MPSLEFRSLTGQQKVEVPEAGVTIGRHPDNVISLPHDEAMSRKHCVVEPGPTIGTWLVRDLQSRNGVRVNGARIVDQTLVHDDVLRVGSTDFRFVDIDAVAPLEPIAADDPVMVARKPDFDARALASQGTIDFDPGSITSDTTYAQQLGRIIDGAPNKPFTEREIALMDCKGTTIHGASAAGVRRAKDEDSESIRLFKLLLLACFRARATDLHMEPKQERSAIRLRVDGVMVPACDLHPSLAKRVLGVVKILCEIDITQRGIVQEGHFGVMVQGRRVDYRVSLTPSMHGQKLVLRVLDQSNAPARLSDLGMLPWMYGKVRDVARRDSGMVLTCGPTGSGKTTTTYSCLREIDFETRNVITIEDPVEYYLDGCTQIPIDHTQGNSFGQILRSVLRQDPDVIFVGEIRDLETASVGLQAATTGHLVYSTVHSKDTIGAVFRLLDLGAEAYQVANAMSLIIAQRLVRVLCHDCRRPIAPTPAQTLKMGAHVKGMSKVFTPVGCPACLRTGYHGRRALFEVLEFNDALRDVVLKRPTITDMKAVLSSGLFTSLQQFGWQLVAAGETNVEEIERVAGTG